MRGNVGNLPILPARLGVLACFCCCHAIDASRQVDGETTRETERNM